MKIIPLIFPLFTALAVFLIAGSQGVWQIDLSVFGLDHLSVGLKATSLANFFAVLIAFSLLAISVVSEKYKLSKSFYFLLYLLTWSMLLIVYASDYLLFFVGWEVMSITTYLLTLLYTQS